ncbi:ABC transporter ATP-binding protein [Dactylosporangium sp. NPDC049140]|uniref:ABC transporter ATP-binding protein n=1 Tax=Dactylosporangium sp. NPDC049140 TaxID=3155647 RepID=UPI0033F8A62B
MSDSPRVSLRSLLPYLRDHRATLVVVGVLSLLGSVTTLAQPLLTRRVLDGLQASRTVWGTVALLVVVLAAVAVITAVRDYLLQRTAEGLVLTSRRRLTRHLLRLPISEYDSRRTGDLLSRVGADSTLLRAVVTSGLFETVTGAVMVVGAAVAMLLLDPILFLTAGLGLALGLSIALVFSRRVRPASEAAQERIGEMTSAVERALSAARTIRASNAEDREIAAVEVSAEGAYHAGVRIARLQALVGPASIAAIQGAFLLLLGVGGARVAAGTISVGDLVAFVLYLFFLVMPLGQALHAYTQLQTGLGALQRMEDILAVPLEADTGTTRPAIGPSAVVFERVTFGYAAAPEPVVRDVSFTVPYGTRTALVGPSGAGKSTLLQLVERFYDVTGGTVRVAGADVRDLPRRALRAQLGYVEQEAPVLAGTLRENLRLTVPGATEAQMLEVLAAVNLTEIVGRTANGLDAQVGEGGVLLSGGERQRLAIARTLLAAPPILLLDEPTSNLDARNEVALREAIDTVARNRTMIVVAHRLSTVVDADQIVVLEAGRVAAVGRHEELLEISPLYRELATNQLLVA